MHDTLRLRQQTSILSGRVAALPKSRYYRSRVFEIGDKVHNLIRIELELGHHGMACPNSLSKCFGKISDRVTQMQFAERRREFLRALSRLLNSVTPRTMFSSECESELGIALPSLVLSEPKN